MFQYLNERRAKSKRRNTVSVDVPAPKRSFRNRKPTGLSVSALSSALSWGSTPSPPLVTITPLVASPTFSYVDVSTLRSHSSLCLTSPPPAGMQKPTRFRRSTTDLRLYSGPASASSSKSMEDYFTFPPLDDTTTNIMLDDWTRVEQIDGDLEADLEMEGYDELLVNGVKI